MGCYAKLFQALMLEARHPFSCLSPHEQADLPLTSERDFSVGKVFVL
jgi:hypothetical protein